MTTRQPRLQRQLLNAILSSTQQRVYLLDTDLNIVYANRAALDLHGYQRRPPNWTMEALSRATMNGASEDFLADVRAVFDASTVPPERVTSWEINGEQSWSRSRIYPINDEDNGSVIYAAIFATDVTEAKKAAEERRKLVTAILEAQEAERQRISADLHDDIVQVMTAMLMRRDMLWSKLPPEIQEDLRDEWEASRELMREALERTRTLMFELRPAVLEARGLGAAVSEVIRELNLTDCTDLQADVARTSPLTEATAYRVVREVLLNIDRHALASNIRVHLWIVNDRIVGEIEDDGSGFDFNKWREKVRDPAYKHLGLASTLERVNLAGGEAHVDTAPGKGTRFSFWIPATPISESIDIDAVGTAHD